MEKKKNIGIVAHDNKKKDIMEWVAFNADKLLNHNLICTGTTGYLVEEVLKKHEENEGLPHDFNLIKLKSGPLGGDQQIGSLISEGRIDIIIFLWDPMQPQPHDVDVKALLRIAVLYNIPVACNRSSADFLISSTLFESAYNQKVSDYSEYINRNF
jgi:methylglyoxal synthase